MAKNPKFETEGYSITIHAKNFPMSEAIQNYVIEKLSRIERLSTDMLDIVIVLDVQKLEHSASILLKFSHFQIRSHASTDTIYAAIDKAADRITRLIRKYKTQLQEHRTTNMGTVDLDVNVLKPQRDEVAQINAEIDAANWRRDQAPYFHDVVSKDKLKIRMLTKDEAVMKMELSHDFFMVYKGEEDQKLKVMYRREEDDNFGLIDIE